MHEYYQIKGALIAVLTSAGFRETTERLEPDVFGSAWSEFSDGNKTLRMVWDGKDGRGFVQIQKDREWEDIPIYVAEASAVEFARRTDELRDRLSVLLGYRAT